jgi:putative toxin-antitoxin system antitoxin component (TIGR02293 family)
MAAPTPESSAPIVHQLIKQEQLEENEIIISWHAADAAPLPKPATDFGETWASLHYLSLIAGVNLMASEAMLRGCSARLQPGLFRGLWQDSFDANELYNLVIPHRTLARRIATNDYLSVDETDKALRLSRADEMAVRVFGDRERASRWLRRKNHQLNDQTPLELLRTETGARIVEELLVQIDHGIFA